MTSKSKLIERELGTKTRDESRLNIQYQVFSGSKVTRIYRENVRDIKFRLGSNISNNPCPLDTHVIWFPWHLAVCPKPPPKPPNTLTKKSVWRKRRRGAGFLRKKLFYGYRRLRSIYEIGVRLPDKKRIYAVYYKEAYHGMTSGIYKFMLKDVKVAQEVHDIIKRNGTVWMRRGVLNTMNDVLYKFTVGYIRTFYSYAWKSKDPETGEHRLVKKGLDFQISGPPLCTMQSLIPYPSKTKNKKMTKSAIRKNYEANKEYLKKKEKVVSITKPYDVNAYAQSNPPDSKKAEKTSKKS